MNEGRQDNRGNHRDSKASNEEAKTNEIEFAAMKKELELIKNKLVEANNEIADNSCLYCLDFMSPDSRYSKENAPPNARLNCSHTNFHMQCAVNDI